VRLASGCMTLKRVQIRPMTLSLEATLQTLCNRTYPAYLFYNCLFDHMKSEIFAQSLPYQQRKMANNSIWLQPGLNQNQFVALTNLLSLRNNGQVEPTSIYEESDPDERTDDGDDSESIDTSVGQQLSGSGNDTLKRQFLDDVAEFAAKEHGARFVACTVMREYEEDVEILIVRNTPFEPSDFEFFDKFSDLVSSWSSHQHTPPAIETRSWIVEWTNYFWDIFSAKNGRS
jgi:hypothetical protein